MNSSGGHRFAERFLEILLYKDTYLHSNHSKYNPVNLGIPEYKNSQKTES